MLGKIREEREIPETWKEASISLIHKDGTEATEIKNYRPISLLNADYKIFTSILVSRLKKVLSQIIHHNQAGFLPKWQLRRNIRIIIDILELHEKHLEKELVLIFLDAQKAFDNVNWSFIIEQLENMRTGEFFLEMY